MLKDKYSKIITDKANSILPKKVDTVYSGFDLLDKSMKGGFRLGCCYLFAGLEKSGKSSFLFNIISNRILSGYPVGILSTEMELEDLSDRLVDIAGIDDKDTTGKNYWKEQMEMYFTFYGKEELTTGNKYDFNKFLTAIDEMEKEHIDLVIVDNLTTLGAEAGDYKILGSHANQLNTYVKNKRMSVIYVIHVKPNVTYKDSDDGIKSLIKQGKMKELLDDAVTVIKRPSLNDVYGGGQAHSQISGGALMIWRPFQKYSVPRYQRMGKIIIDSHRYGPPGDIYCEYDGDTGKFILYEKDNEPKI